MQKLENRLININRRNRLLYSSKVNKDYGIDIFTILENVEEFVIIMNDGKRKSEKRWGRKIEVKIKK